MNNTSTEVSVDTELKTGATSLLNPEQVQNLLYKYLPKGLHLTREEKLTFYQDIFNEVENLYCFHIEYKHGRRMQFESMELDGGKLRFNFINIATGNNHRIKAEKLISLFSKRSNAKIVRADRGTTVKRKLIF